MPQHRSRHTHPLGHRPAPRQIGRLFALLGLALTSCSALQEPPPASFGPMGPAHSPAEQHARTFEALWTRLETDYLYFDDASVDWNALHDRYLSRVSSEPSEDGFVEAIRDLQAELPTGALSWESRTERIAADITDTSTYAGIGAFVAFAAEPEPRVIILSVMDGSPAHKSGLRAHDSILAVDGEKIRAEEGLGVIDRIRGPADSLVRLQIHTPGREDRTVTVKRGQLSGEARLAFGIIPGTDVGHLVFPAAGYSGLADEVVEGLTKLTTNRRLAGLILDLRIARSVQGWPLQELFGIFGDGSVGEFYDRDQRQLVRIRGQDVLSSQTVPLVILVGEHTSGFPEILAAGLQATGRATVVGGRTSAAVETSLASYLPDGSRLLIESASFRLLDGTEIGRTGVVPSLEIESGWDQILPDEDPVLDAALEVLLRSE